MYTPSPEEIEQCARLCESQGRRFTIKALDEIISTIYSLPKPNSVRKSYLIGVATKKIFIPKDLKKLPTHYAKVTKMIVYYEIIKGIEEKSITACTEKDLGFGLSSLPDKLWIHRFLYTVFPAHPFYDASEVIPDINGVPLLDGLMEVQLDPANRQNVRNRNRNAFEKFFTTLSMNYTRSYSSQTVLMKTQAICKTLKRIVKCDSKEFVDNLKTLIDKIMTDKTPIDEMALAIANFKGTIDECIVKADVEEAKNKATKAIGVALKVKLSNIFTSKFHAIPGAKLLQEKYKEIMETVKNIFDMDPQTDYNLFFKEIFDRLKLIEDPDHKNKPKDQPIWDISRINYMADVSLRDYDNSGQQPEPGDKIEELYLPIGMFSNEDEEAMVFERTWHAKALTLIQAINEQIGTHKMLLIQAAEVSTLRFSSDDILDRYNTLEPLFRSDLKYFKSLSEGMDKYSKDLIDACIKFNEINQRTSETDTLLERYQKMADKWKSTYNIIKKSIKCSVLQLRTAYRNSDLLGSSKVIDKDLKSISELADVTITDMYKYIPIVKSPHIPGIEASQTQKFKALKNKEDQTPARKHTTSQPSVTREVTTNLQIPPVSPINQTPTVPGNQEATNNQLTQFEEATTPKRRDSGSDMDLEEALSTVVQSEINRGNDEHKYMLPSSQREFAPGPLDPALIQAYIQKPFSKERPKPIDYSAMGESLIMDISTTSIKSNKLANIKEESKKNSLHHDALKNSGNYLDILKQSKLTRDDKFWKTFNDLMDEYKNSRGRSKVVGTWHTGSMKAAVTKIIPSIDMRDFFMLLDLSKVYNSSEYLDVKPK